MSRGDSPGGLVAVMGFVLMVLGCAALFLPLLVYPGPSLATLIFGVVFMVVGWRTHPRWRQFAMTAELFEFRPDCPTDPITAQLKTSVNHMEAQYFVVARLLPVE